MQQRIAAHREAMHHMQQMQQSPMVRTSRASRWGGRD